MHMYMYMYVYVYVHIIHVPGILDLDSVLVSEVPLIQGFLINSMCKCSSAYRPKQVVLVAFTTYVRTFQYTCTCTCTCTYTMYVYACVAIYM